LGQPRRKGKKPRQKAKLVIAEATSTDQPG